MHVRDLRVGNGKNHVSNHLLPTTLFTYDLFPLETCSEAAASLSLNGNSHLAPAIEGSPGPSREPFFAKNLMLKCGHQSEAHFLFSGMSS